MAVVEGGHIFVHLPGRLGPPLWRPELELPESPKRPRSAPLRRSASQPAAPAAPLEGGVQRKLGPPRRPASAGQLRPKKVQHMQRRSVPQLSYCMLLPGPQCKKKEHHENA